MQISRYLFADIREVFAVVLGAISLINKDFLWLRETVFFLDSLRDPHEDPVPGCNPMKDYGYDFLSYVKIASRSSLDDAGPQSASPKRAPGTLCCSVCFETSDAFQECVAHQFEKHGSKSTLCQRISGTICAFFCMKDFHTRTKLHIHIAYHGANCKTYYINCVQCIDRDAYLRLEQDEANESK